MAESIWLRASPAARGTGRPAEWSREQIVAAATEIAQAEGLARITMRAVAGRLGTGPASLYRHVASRDDVVDLIADAALARYEPPPITGDWRADVVAEHLGRLNLLRRTPWLADAALERPPTGPAMIRIMEDVLERLRPAPGTHWAKLEALGVLTGLLYTSVRHERPGGVMTVEFATTRFALLARAAADGAHPRLAEVLAQGRPETGESLDDQLGRVVRLILDGLLTRR